MLKKCSDSPYSKYRHFHIKHKHTLFLKLLSTGTLYSIMKLFAKIYKTFNNHLCSLLFIANCMYCKSIKFSKSISKNSRYT